MGNNWRPMDSAPRDGTRVLVCRKAVAGNARNAEPVRTARWKDGSWCSTDPAGSMWTDRVLLAWQPMPEPPPVIVQFSRIGMPDHVGTSVKGAE
jgi:hypothetical protein